MKKFRSDCPLSRILDVVGDKWTLLVLRDIVAFKKTTFKEISMMHEYIATNTLSDRLNKLVTEGFIKKKRNEKNRLVYHYLPTAKAIDLLHSLMTTIKWSEKHLYRKNESPAAFEQHWLGSSQLDDAQFVQQ